MALFGDVTDPLNKLLRKDTKFQWTQQCQAAYTHLNQGLCREPFLLYLCTEKLYMLFTDASHYAYSSILIQEGTVLWISGLLHSHLTHSWLSRLNRWSMELADYKIKLIYIKGKHNILADTISRLKMLNIYKEWLENPKVQAVNNTQQVVTEVCATGMQTISINMLHNEQNWDNMCKKLASQNSSKSFTLSADGVLQKN